MIGPFKGKEMKKINWITRKHGDREAVIGGMVLECVSRNWRSTPRDWRGSASLFKGLPNRGVLKIGQVRKSPEKAMEDAIRLGREIMEDYSVALAKIAKRLGSNEI